MNLYETIGESVTGLVIGAAIGCGLGWLLVGLGMWLARTLG
ncbi:MAG: hypothetical protein NTW96_27645 [Planctomycetia bacterium]|nr:hypothetical protein [Planctomycetia bacterium]